MKRGRTIEERPPGGKRRLRKQRNGPAVGVLEPGLYAPRAGAPSARGRRERGNVTGASSLPPLKKNDGKYGLVALLLLLLAGGLWFYFGRDESEPAAEPTQEPEKTPAREPLAVDLEIPEDDDPKLALDRGGEETDDRSRGTSSATRPEDWVCTGTIDARQVRSVIRGAPSKQVQTCYEVGLKGNNLLQGQMEVELTIGARGRVRAVSVAGTLDDRQVYSCVKRVARSWQFPKPTGGCVRINVPFQMTPKL